MSSRKSFLVVLFWWLLPVCLAAALVACSAKEATTRTKPSRGTSGSSTSGSTDDDDDDANVLIPVEVVDAGAPPDASEQASRYRGILAATPATRFGGVVCTYDVTMKNIEIELAITPSGGVTSGSAKNDMVETIVGTCANPPLGSLPQVFTLTTVNATELTFRGRGGPETSLLVKLTKVGASWEADTTWERTDRTDDLKWFVKSKVTLGPM